jgi:hypothetical protein
MQTTETSQRIEAFLLIEQPRQRLGHWINALAALDSPFAPTLSAVVAYYDPSTDQGLLNLQYARDVLDESGRQYLMNVAILAEVGMVQPAELSEGERVRFLSSRLSRCTIRVTSAQTAVTALTELVKRIKSERTPSALKPPRPPPPPVSAKGTRDNLAKLANEANAALQSPGVSRDLVPRTNRHATARMPDDIATELSAKMLDDDDDDDRLTRPMGMAAIANLSAKVPGPQMIYVRYLRGGRWVPARVGALSLKGAALLAGALPRTHDRVDVELTFGVHRARVCGAVAKVSTMREASQTGAATFTVSFLLDETSKKDLTALLLAARDAKIVIKPPPPRATRRFPVEWQIVLGTPRGMNKSIALDVSTGGMFVRPNAPLQLEDVVSFSVTLDDASAPISGRARVVRRIGEAEANETGVDAGYGLELSDMTEADRMRWLGFLARIERRAEKRVLIGAEPARLAELQAGLASLGYTVVGGTDPGALVQLANAEMRPADAVLIDAGWLQNEASTAIVEKLMAARNVPCVTMNGEVKRARQAIDRLLDVVV